MGGTKKPTVSKLKKMVGRREEKKKEEKKKENYRILISSKEKDELKNYIKKSRYITPYLVSKRMEIKLSAARRILRELADEKVIRLEEKNKGLEIYTLISS